MSLFRDLLIEKKRKPYYCEVEYLESTGTQWIDTGYNINTTTDEVTVYFQLITTEKYSWLMGEHDTGARFGIGSGDKTNLRNIAYGNSTYKVNDTEVYNSQHYFNANSNGVYVNSTLVHTFESFSSTSTIYLFNLNISGGGNGASGKIWRYTHKRNGVLIRDLIPVLDWSYVPCLYDKVSGQLFYNQGTGTFSYGREIHYVDYIESTGTQYIDCGLKGNLNTAYSITSLSTQTEKQCVLFGSRSSATSNAISTIMTSANANNDFGNYNLTRQTVNLNVLNDIITIYNSKNKRSVYNHTTGITDTTTTTYSTSFTTPTNLYIAYKSSGFASVHYNFIGKIYDCKIWDNEALIRDYYPAIDENGVGFMFDKVTHTIFDNAGTGAFKYPAVQTEYLETTTIGACLGLGIKYSSSMSIKFKYTRTGMGTSGAVLPLTTNTTNPVAYFPALDGTKNIERFVLRRPNYNEQKYIFYFSSYPFTKEVFFDAVNDILYIDGENVKEGMIAGMDGYSNPYQSSSNLYMLSIDGSFGGLGKVYYVQLYDTTQVYRDLVPAWKDGSFGMYDKENSVLYTNTKSAGTIVSGKIIESKWF